MNNQKATSKFLYPFEGRAAEEAKDRGYWGQSVAELQDGRTFPVAFYDNVRLPNREQSDLFVHEVGPQRHWISIAYEVLNVNFDGSDRVTDFSLHVD